MSSAFIRAVNFTLEHEGGYSHDLRDPGGETNFGISKRAYPHLNIRDLTREAAIDIYRRDYWEPSGCPSMPEPVAIAHFDCAVNSGLRRAAMVLQEAVGSVPDGVVGIDTLNRLEIALRKHGRIGVGMALIRGRVRFLIDLAQGQQQWTFLRGWMARCVDLAGVVSQSAGAASIPPRVDTAPA